MAKSTSSAAFRVENVILSHIHIYVAEPFKQNGVAQGDPFFSAALLLDETVARLINTTAMEIAQKHYTNGEYNDPTFGWPCTPANLKTDYANNPRTAHLYMCNAKAGQTYPPQIVELVEGKTVRVRDRGSVYSGCVAVVGINVYTRPQPARPGEIGQGVGVGLKAIMKTAEGEPLGGDSVDTNDIFSGVSVQPATPGTSFPGGNPITPVAEAQVNSGMPLPPFMTN